MSMLDSEATPAIIKCCAQHLAPELLAMIFHDVMALHRDERRPILLIPTTDKHSENEIDTKPLLTLTHVCRYWRDVAIGTPALWTRVHGRHQDQMAAFLERSQPLAVTLFLDGEHEAEEWDGTLTECMASVVRAHSPRLHRLDLAMIPTWNDVVPLLVSLPAPQLECLTMMSPLACSSFRDIGMISWTPLLRDASSLRALGLLPVVDWLPSSAFPNLTHLDLYFYPGAEALHHPFDLLRLLSNTPALEFLHVDLLNYEEPYMGSWRPPSDPVPLPNLRSLVFSDCPYELLHAVLPHLFLPEDVFIRLQGIVNYLPVEGPPAPLSPLPVRGVTHLDVSKLCEEPFMVADGPTSGLWFQVQHDLGGHLEPQGWGAWLLSLHECLTLSSVTQLHIHVAGWETFWPAFLVHVPQVSHLTALLGELGNESNPVTDGINSPTSTLCHALSQYTPILCPVLSTLMIEWPHADTYEDIRRGIPRLLDMLEARNSAGHPVRRVVVQAPSGSPSDQIRMDLLNVHRLARASSPRGTELEIVEKPTTGKGLCAFEMRGVWTVDGEDIYWETDDHGKPNYDAVCWD